MSDFVIYENPGNKAARLERENAQLRAENRSLRAQLGELAGAEIATQVVSQAPRIAPQTTFQHGACSVTIGARPGAGRPGGTSAIPSLEQAQQEGERATPQVQIFDSRAPVQVTAPVAKAQPRAAQRMVAGQPQQGGMMFEIGALRPVPVKPQGAPRIPGPPIPLPVPSAVDDARQRFAMIELDETPQEQQINQQDQAGQGKAG